MAEAPSAADVPPQAPAEPEAALELKHCALGDMGGMMAKSDDNRRSNTPYKSEASYKSNASVGHDGRMHFNARPRSVSQDLGDCDGDGVAAVRTSGYMSREVATQQSRLTSSLLDKLGLSKKLSFIGSAAIRPLRRSSSIMSQISCTSAVFDDTRVGTFTQHGLAPTAEASTAKINQDRGCVCFPFGSDSATKPMALFCVFDGHGARPPRPHPPAAVRFVCDAREPSRCLLPPSRHPPRVFLWPCRRAGRQGLPLRDERDPEEARGPPVARE